MRRLIFFVFSRECSLGAHGLLRFRTDDVLLGTSGVGMCVCSLGNVLRVWAAARTLPGRPTSILLTTAGNPSSIEWPPVRNRQLDPTILFSTHERAQFCSRCLLRFRTRVLGQAARSRCVGRVFVTGVFADNKQCGRWPARGAHEPGGLVGRSPLILSLRSLAHVECEVASRLSPS